MNRFEDFEEWELNTISAGLVMRMSPYVKDEALSKLYSECHGVLEKKRSERIARLPKCDHCGKTL